LAFDYQLVCQGIVPKTLKRRISMSLNLDETLDAIKKLSDEEILSLAMPRPGHPGAYGFILNSRMEYMPEITVALMGRLGDVELPKNEWGKYVGVTRKA
jgi:hypothetical protein